MTDFKGHSDIGAAQVTGSGGTANDGNFEIIDALAATFAEVVDDSNAFTITDVTTTWRWERAMTWIFSDDSTPPDALITVDVPDGSDPNPSRGVFGIINLTSQPMQVEITGQSLVSPVIQSGARALLCSDGTNVFVFGGTEEIHFFQHGAPGASDDIWIKVFTSRTTVNDALLGSEAFAKGAPSGGAVVYDLRRNDIKIGDITFADGVATATFATEAAQQYVFEPGDYATIHSPANVQSMTDVSFNIFGFRS